jgi:hypothetical protein
MFDVNSKPLPTVVAMERNVVVVVVCSCSL